MHTSTAENPLSLSESHHRKPCLFVRIAPPKALFSVRFASLMRDHRKRSSLSISHQPGQNPEHQRQMMVPELQMQVAQGNSQGVPPFVGLSSAFSNQTSPPAQTYPLHPQQAHVPSNSQHPYLQGPNHAASTQHQAYAMRIAKERQMQQRLQLPQQHQQQFVASNALMPHVQSQSQLPMSSSMQNSSQVQPQRRTGMPRFKAREVVTEAIQRKGLYRGAKNNEMRLGICSRSNDVVEPLIKPQWYVNCNSMAKQALDAVFDDKNRKIEIIPKQYAAEWKRWLDNIRDWCFSRQLWWGHRIPAWYVTLEDDELKELGAYNDHWVVARNEEEAQTEANRIFPGKKLQMSQDPDVLDTWFSSGLFPLSVLGWPDDTNDLKAFYPTSVLETGHDILFFWVACMVMLGIKLGGDVPFTKEFSGRVKCLKVDAVDTIGARDAFVAGILSQLAADVTLC